jgi:DNA-directed RNA polymerase specialized sigma24 family protein
VRLAQVREAFGRLPAEQREALHLVTIEGLAYQEAAAPRPCGGAGRR